MVFSAELLSCCRSWQGDRRPARCGDHHGGEGEGRGCPEGQGILTQALGVEPVLGGGPCILLGLGCLCGPYLLKVQMLILLNTQGTPPTMGHLLCCV